MLTLTPMTTLGTSNGYFAVAHLPQAHATPPLWVYKMLVLIQAVGEPLHDSAAELPLRVCVPPWSCWRFPPQVSPSMPPYPILWPTNSLV